MAEFLFSLAPWGKVNNTGQHYCGDKGWFHFSKIVTQQHLTSCYLCNTVISMANVLSTDKQIAVIGALAEGSAKRVYAWAHGTDDPKKPRRHVTVLHVGAVTSAVMAVKAAIVEEFRSGEPTPEEA